LLTLFGLLVGSQLAASAAVPDISEWQGQLTSTQVKSLKSQVSFVINRVQYGSFYEDLYHASNEALYAKYGVLFGSYDYATFTSNSAAIAEAKTFYARTSKATRFYVLDFEVTNGMSASTANAAVKAWYTEMRALTSKKLIFYSYQSFATTYAPIARKAFDAQWIANYSSRPTIPYSLWQYSSSYYLSALNESVDNNVYTSDSVTDYRPLSWWLGTTTTYAYSSYTKGQHVYLNQGASKYYDRTTVPQAAKQKYYKITAVKTATTSRSKQLVYLAGLNKWVLAQDVTGYWIGQHGKYTLRQNANLYSNIDLTHKTGKTLHKGQTVAGKLVKRENFYRLKFSGGYVTAKVAFSDHAYYESLPSSRRVTAKIPMYSYKQSTFNAKTRKAKAKAGQTFTVTAIHQRADGSRYYRTKDGGYISALHSTIKTD